MWSNFKYIFHSYFNFGQIVVTPQIIFESELFELTFPIIS